MPAYHGVSNTGQTIYTDSLDMARERGIIDFYGPDGQKIEKRPLTSDEVNYKNWRHYPGAREVWESLGGAPII